MRDLQPHVTTLRENFRVNVIIINYKLVKAISPLPRKLKLHFSLLFFSAGLLDNAGHFVELRATSGNKNWS